MAKVNEGSKIHAEATKAYQERGLLSQKDLMSRMGFNSVRSVQRLRACYGLKPSGWWGINPLFTLSEVERVEKLLAKRRAIIVSKNMARCRKEKFRLISVAVAQKRAKRKARK